MHDAPPLTGHPDARDGFDGLDGPPPGTSVKVAHLVFALLFLGAAGAWALVAGDVITTERLPVLLPALLVAAGVVGLLASVAGSHNRRRPRPAGSATSRPATDTTGTTRATGTADRDPGDPGDPGDSGESRDPGEDDGTEPTQVLR